MAFDVLRAGHVIELSAVVDAVEEGETTIGRLGIQSTSLTQVSLPPGKGLLRACEKFWSTIMDTVNGVVQAVTKGNGTENFTGVVGITQLTGQAVEQGAGTILALIGILSANIALMNLLPIPILDGGALVLCLVELVLRRPISARAQAIGAGTGVSLLASMFLLSLAHDLQNLGLFQWLAGF